MERSHRRLSPLSPSSPRRIAAACAALALAGCATVGPDYTRPQLPAPESYLADESAAGAAAEEAAVAPGWWMLFGDSELERLIGLALVENADLHIALARLEEARALAGAARAERFPEVGVSATGSRTQVSTETTPLPPGVSAKINRFRVTGTVAFDLDPWGRLRRRSEAAEAVLLATRYGADALRLSLAGDVARAYFELRTLDRQLEIARSTREARRETLELQQLRFDAGVISELELAQARAELAATEAAVPDLERAVATTQSRLSILTGRNPEALPRGRALESLELPPTVPPGLPSALLERRPDIASAEAALVAANAEIGVAKAAYFPQLSLTGYAGTESLELSGLLAAGSTIWQAAASLVAPVFNAGRTRRQVEAARARRVEAFETYRKTVQEAFGDVEDALVARRTTAARRLALGEEADALTDALALAELRYEAGVSSYLEVLDAQRNLFQVELDLAAVRRDELTAAVALFEALGGGWHPDASPLSPPAAETPGAR